MSSNSTKKRGLELDVESAAEMSLPKKVKPATSVQLKVSPDMTRYELAQAVANIDHSVRIAAMQAAQLVVPFVDLLSNDDDKARLSANNFKSISHNADGQKRMAHNINRAIDVNCEREADKHGISRKYIRHGADCTMQECHCTYRDKIDDDNEKKKFSFIIDNNEQYDLLFALQQYS